MSQFREHRSKNNKKGLWIGIIVGVILIAGGILGYNYWRNEQRKNLAHETATIFIESLETQDYEKLSNMLSTSSLEEINYTKEDVHERYETIYNGIGVTSITAENMTVNENDENDQFEIAYDLHMNTSLGELSKQSYQTKLIEGEDGFDVDWHTQLIFPDMELDDIVRITLDSGQRGNILDRNGLLLSGETPAWQAGLYPAQLGEAQEREEQLEIIAETFGSTTDHLENVLSAGWVTEDSFVPFKIVDEGETPEIQGVVYQETSARSYPLGEAGAHLIGYIGEVSAEDIEEDPTLQAGEVIGKSGLEAAYDSRLREKKGGKVSILNQDGEEKAILQEAPVENGEDITITIDANLQQDYYNQFNNESGAAVVTNPISGELLVLTSSPSYNPTLMSRGISVEAYQEYAEDERTPFLPRYTARYAPGSTFKAITAAIGLDAGVTTLDKTHTITGYEWQKDESWGSYEVTRVSAYPTEVQLKDALIYSDNIFFAREAIEMGAETYTEGLLQFPFGEVFDLPLAQQPAQISNSGSFDNERLLADTSFGQGELLMSPLQQAVFYSPFANNGQLVYPKIEMNNEAAKSIQPISEEAAERIKDILIEVVEDPNGTAHVLSGSSKTLAAKTGTTEVQAQSGADGNDTHGFLFAFDEGESSFLSVILIEDASGSYVAETFNPILSQ